VGAGRLAASPLCSQHLAGSGLELEGHAHLAAANMKQLNMLQLGTMSADRALEVLKPSV